MHSLPIRVYLEDTDRFGLVYHANYVKFFERGRTEWLRAQAIELEALYQSGFKMVVAKLDINFSSPACLDDMLTVETELLHCKMSMAIFEQRLVNQSNNQIANATVKIIGLDRNNKLCHISKILKSTTG